MRKGLGLWAILSVLALSVVFVAALSSPSQAARKAKGEVVAAVQPGGDLCQAMSGVLKEKEDCSSNQLSGDTSLVLVQSEKKLSVKKDQPVILKSKDAGKTTGKVIDVVNLPVDTDTLKALMKDRKCLIFWHSEKGDNLAVIQPEKEFMPKKGQQVKLKVKEVTKVEGC